MKTNEYEFPTLVVPLWNNSFSQEEIEKMSDLVVEGLVIKKNIAPIPTVSPTLIGEQWVLDNHSVMSKNSLGEECLKRYLAGHDKLCFWTIAGTTTLREGSSIRVSLVQHQNKQGQVVLMPQHASLFSIVERDTKKSFSVLAPKSYRSDCDDNDGRVGTIFDGPARNSMTIWVNPLGGDDSMEPWQVMLQSAADAWRPGGININISNDIPIPGSRNYAHYHAAWRDMIPPQTDTAACNTLGITTVTVGGRRPNNGSLYDMHFNK